MTSPPPSPQPDHHTPATPASAVGFMVRLTSEDARRAAEMAWRALHRIVLVHNGIRVHGHHNATGVAIPRRPA